MKNLALITILFIAVIGCKQTEQKTPASTNTVSSAPIVTVSPTAETPSITLAKFNQLKTGMAYKEVVNILGTDGEIISESDIGGTKTVMYQWQSSGFGNMNAMFQNGKLISKSQFGLK
jgi:hypothetical protein